VYKYRGYVNRVIDGDTIEVNVELGFDVFIDVIFRLDGINAPEMKGAAKEAGERARDFLREFLEGEVVEIQSHGREKYGRWLATIYAHGGQNVNQIMLNSGLAVPYHGEKR
jgi:micrococcal nuclease